VSEAGSSLQSGHFDVLVEPPVELEPLMLPAEPLPDAAPVVLLSFGFWMQSALSAFTLVSCWQADMLANLQSSALPWALWAQKAPEPVTSMSFDFCMLDWALATDRPPANAAAAAKAIKVFMGFLHFHVPSLHTRQPVPRSIVPERLESADEKSGRLSPPAAEIVVSPCQARTATISNDDGSITTICVPTRTK
jgi:hypothetical protein